MEVQRVQNTPTSFNGYVDKSVKKYVNTAVSNSMDKVIIHANEHNKPVEIKELVRLKELGKEILTKLENYMASTHKKTSIAMKDAYNNDMSLAFSFKNPLTPAEIDTLNCRVHRKTFNNDQIGERELCYLNRATEELLDEIRPHTIDKEILVQANEEIGNLAKSATNFFKRLILKHKAKSTRRFANEISETAGDNIQYIDNVLMWAKSAQKEKISTNNRKIIKDNWNTKRKVLKD